MPQVCTICSHPQRLQIEAALVRGASLRNVAKQFDASAAAIHRHRNNCMKQAIAVANEERAAIQHGQAALSGWNAFSEMQWLHQETRQLYREVRGEPGGQAAQEGDKEKTPGDPRLALAAIGEIRKQTQLFAELLQGAEQANQKEREQEWVNLRESIFTALEPFPDARLAVARALLALSQEQEGGADDRDAGYKLG